MSRGQSLLRVAVAYVVAIGVGVLWLTVGPRTEWRWLDALVADVLATLVVFAASRMYRNSSFYDAYWSVIPPLLVVYWWAERDPAAEPVRFWLLFAVVLVWAVRLTGNWLSTFPGLHHEDWRYPLLKERAGRAEPVVDLVAIHVIPTFQVFLGCLGAYAVTRYGGGLWWLDVVAVLVGVGAVAAGDRRRRADAPVRPGQAAGAGDGPRRVVVVAASQLRGRAGLLVLAGAVRPGRVAVGVVGAARPGRDARDVPRREHPDDGGAQPGAAAAVPGRRRPGLAVRAAPARVGHEPTPGRRRRPRRHRRAHRGAAGTALRGGGRLGEARPGERPGARPPAHRPRAVGAGLPVRLRPAAWPRPGERGARRAHRRRPRRAVRGGSAPRRHHRAARLRRARDRHRGDQRLLAAPGAGVGRRGGRRHPVAPRAAGGGGVDRGGGRWRGGGEHRGQRRAGVAGEAGRPLLPA